MAKSGSQDQLQLMGMHLIGSQLQLVVVLAVTVVYAKASRVTGPKGELREGHPLWGDVKLEEVEGWPPMVRIMC